MTFQDGQRISRETNLSVDGCWIPAGQVDPKEARVTGIPDMEADTNGVWRVTGMGTLGRKIPTKQVFVPTSSQFRNKADSHESEHLAHWQPGNLFGNLHNPADFFARIQNFTGTSRQDLINKLSAELTTYTNEQGQIYEQNRVESEKRAYAVSDPIAPKYLYQNCGRYQ